MRDDDATEAAYHLDNAATLLNDMGSKYAARGVVYAKTIIERLAAENARLTTDVERLTLVWSSEPPKGPGLHWIKTFDGIVWTHDFTENDFKKGTVEIWYEDGCLIAGPIPTPLERDADHEHERSEAR